MNRSRNRPTSSLPARRTPTPRSTSGWPISRNDQLGTVIQTRRVGKKPFTDTYHYVNQVPLRNSDDAILANWCELVTTNAAGDIVFRNAWATSHAITDQNVASLVAAGRARWKIENENNNMAARELVSLPTASSGLSLSIGPVIQG